jgi:hypothetical protein
MELPKGKSLRKPRPEYQYLLWCPETETLHARRVNTADRSPSPIHRNRCARA